MFSKIRELIAFVKGFVGKADEVLLIAADVLAFVKSLLSQIEVAPLVGSPEAEKTLDDLDAFCATQEQQNPPVALPAWLLPVVLRLIEEVLRKKK